MKPFSGEDPLARGLADLPPVAPLEPARADAVRRLARDALVETERLAPSTRLSLAWSAVILPGLLLSSGFVYVWDSVQKIGQIYGGG
ncbi:hypothetical protein WME73_35010 [Sorangium sp. So ce302]|uniref:hypothetical protein n=1 Tax=Sorangium sp. So ce302 TaxID=3133297 RepID=UPI003F5DBF14